MLQNKAILKILVLTVMLMLCFTNKSVGDIVNPGFEFEHDISSFFPNVPNP